MNALLLKAFNILVKKGSFCSTKVLARKLFNAKYHTNNSTLRKLVFELLKENSCFTQVEDEGWMIGDEKFLSTPIEEVRFAAVDFELVFTKVLEIGIVSDEIHSLYRVNPKRKIPPVISRITGIKGKQARKFSDFEEIVDLAWQDLEGKVLVMHDPSEFPVFTTQTFKSKGTVPFFPVIINTIPLLKILYPELEKYKLSHVAKSLLGEDKIDMRKFHSALYDAEVTWEIFKKRLMPKLKETGIRSLYELIMFPKGEMKNVS